MTILLICRAWQEVGLVARDGYPLLIGEICKGGTAFAIQHVEYIVYHVIFITYFWDCPFAHVQQHKGMVILDILKELKHYGSAQPACG